MNNVILYANAIVCLISSLYIVNFNPKGHVFNRYYGFSAWILAVAFFSVPTRVFMGSYTGPGEISELVINSYICIKLILCKGNVAYLIRFKKSGVLEKNKKEVSYETR